MNIFEQIVNEPEFRATMMLSLNNSDENVKELENSIRRKENEIKKSKVKQE